MGKHRIDTPDTLDPIIGLVLRLQAEGWGLDHVGHHIEYGRTHKRSPKIPVAAELVIRLKPASRD